jgi:hypothetical protein
MDENKAGWAVIFVGALVRLAFWLTTPVTGDAALNFDTARRMAETLALPPVGQPGHIPLWYPPLFHIVSAVLYRLTSAITLAPLVFGIAGLIMFHLFCRRFYPRHALWATTILAFLPFHVYYSSIGYFDGLIFFLAVAAYYFYLSHLEGGSGRDLAYAVLMSALAGLTHYHGLIPLLSISAHLFLRDRRKAAFFLVAGILLSSPWYLRNLVVFGNPFWPKLGGGYYPSDVEAAGPPLPDTLASFFSPQKWVSLFFDFWLGAPNSGEDFQANIAVGEATYPLFDFLMLPWLLAVVAATAAALLGGYAMRGDRLAPLAAIVLAVSLIPSAGNGLARMFVSFIPFIPLALSAGLDRVRFKRKHAVLLACLVLFLAGSYAYSYTYKTIRDGYAPFFASMANEIPPRSKVIMPFNVQECLYFSGKDCLRLGTMGGEALTDESDIDSLVSEYGADYVCCSSLNWAAQPPEDKRLCDHYRMVKPDISYQAGGLWGRCWKP